MPLSVGDKLGHYEVRSLLGKGGMGEVYRARDTTLKRDVALKVLPATFLRDPERMARFQREAQVLASLDHPNIGHIHGIVDSEDSRGLVLALIEGPTLADRIEAGPLPQEEAFAIAKQIIEALEYAHERGVVHRDLKPANVKITPEGVVKVLDFGLAKVLEDEPPASSLTNSPTLTVGHTRAGVILGTAAYMSPEQAVGRTVDRRSDIFSFGAVLYEMLTGKRAFAGATTPDVLEAVVKNDPDWAALPGATPGTIAGLLQRCLTKDRKQRLQAIGEARIVLEKPGGAESPAQAGSLPTRNSRWWLWAGLGVATLAAATLGFFAYRHFTEETRVLRLFVPPPEQGSYDTGNSTNVPAVSPDGRRIVFVANVGGKSALWVRDLDSLAPRMLAGTDDPRHPFWSPDSRSIGFFSAGKLKRIDVAGGPAQTVADAENGRGGTEQQAGGMDIWLYDLARGGADSRFTFGPVSNFYPVWSPDSSHIAFTSNREGTGRPYQRAAAGTGQDEPLDKSAGAARPTDWSHDGRYILEQRPGDKTRDDVWVLPLTGEKKEPFKYLDTEFSEDSARLSPDGRWLAYTSDETKRSEIYVASFPMKGSKWKISTGGGDRPIWSRDGKEIYFISADQKMMAATILAGAQFASVPKALFDVRIRNFQSFDVSKEGRFLIPVQGEQAASAPMTVVVNWQAGLKK